VIGAFVSGLSMRDVESLCEQAGLGKLSKATASRMCEELKERFERFRRRDLYEVRLVALFLDATFIAVRPNGPKEGVLVAWGFTDEGERVLLSVSLGMRESFEDWQTLGRDLISRGLGAPMLIVADGAPGLTKAIEQCWPASDRQRCCVHRARNLYAKLPERERDRVKQAYWQALDEAISEEDGRRRLRELAGELDREGFTAAARCLSDDLDALVVHLRYPLRHRKRWRAPHQGDGTLPRREQLPHPGVGRTGPAHHPPDQRHPPPKLTTTGNRITAAKRRNPDRSAHCLNWGRPTRRREAEPFVPFPQIGPVGAGLPTYPTSLRQTQDGSSQRGRRAARCPFQRIVILKMLCCEGLKPNECGVERERTRTYAAPLGGRLRR
jgi:hypothetical protein